MKKSIMFGCATLLAAFALSTSISSFAKPLELNGFCRFLSTDGNASFGTCISDPDIKECDTALGTNGAVNTDCPR
jgi:hypothetical protein